jgi:hypothetical protein
MSESLQARRSAAFELPRGSPSRLRDGAPVRGILGVEPVTRPRRGRPLPANER